MAYGVKRVTRTNQRFAWRSRSKDVLDHRLFFIRMVPAGLYKKRCGDNLPVPHRYISIRRVGSLKMSCFASDGMSASVNGRFTASMHS